MDPEPRTAVENIMAAHAAGYGDKIPILRMDIQDYERRKKEANDCLLLLETYLKETIASKKYNCRH